MAAEVLFQNINEFSIDFFRIEYKMSFFDEHCLRHGGAIVRDPCLTLLNW